MTSVPKHKVEEVMRLVKTIHAQESRGGLAETQGHETLNLLERLNKEIRRRTRVVGSFPDGQSAIALISARLRHIMTGKWGYVRYMNMSLLTKEADMTGTE